MASDFVTMVDDVAGSGHEDVVAVNEEGLERFAFVVLGVAEVFQVDGRRLGHGRRLRERARLAARCGRS